MSGQPGDSWDALGQEDKDFLGRRWAARHFDTSPPNWRCWGISADALALVGAGLANKISRGNFPYDWDDFLSCERTMAMGTPEQQRRMRPWLDRFRESVEVNRGSRKWNRG